MDYRKLFPIFDNNENLHYLDTAATSQKPKRIIERLAEYYEKFNANPGRGAHDLSIKSSDLLTQARKKVQEFINASEECEIIFTKHTTESINLIAYSYALTNINEGDEIILGISNHHANILPWQMVAQKKKAILKYIYLDKDGQLDLDDLQYKLTNKTKIVSLSWVVNTTGVIQPVKPIIDLVHEKGGIVVVDAAQAVSHFKPDVQALDADFFVFSGHKIFSPMGVGVLYGKKELLENMPPFILGGNMIEFVTEQHTTFAPLPQKFEAGTQDVAAIDGLREALCFIEEIGYETIQKLEHEYEMKMMFELKKLDMIEVYHTVNVERVGVFAFNVKNVHSHDVAFILDSFGVAVRSGHHCTQPLLNYLAIPSCCRMSFGLYTNDQDIEKLIEGLKKVKEVFGI